MMVFGHISHQQLGQLAQQVYSSPHAPLHAGLSLHAATFLQLSQHSATLLLLLTNLWNGFGQCLSFTSPQQGATPRQAISLCRWDPGSMTLLIFLSVGVIIHPMPELPAVTSSNRLRRLHPHH